MSVLIPIMDKRFSSERYKVSPEGFIWDENQKKRVKMYMNTFLVSNLSLIAGGRSTVRVHMQIAKHFLPNPEGLKNVKFLDGDRGNIHVDNLQWCKKSEMGIVHKRNSSNGMHSKSSVDLETIAKVFQMKRKGCTYQEIANETGKVVSWCWKVVNNQLHSKADVDRRLD